MNIVGVEVRLGEGYGYPENRRIMENRENFGKYLMAWYESRLRPLPWRESRDPYAIWVSEVMLQQTQVKTVLEYYMKFMARFPNVRRLATADLHHVLMVWEGMGYYARARNLHRAAGVVLETCGGRVPDRYEIFRKLPGVGDYIASAVLSIAFGQAFPVVDGNVKRVLARVFQIDEPVNTPGAYRRCKEMAGMLLNSKQPGVFNQAMMELGALVCTPKQPDCPGCPVQTYCRAHRFQRVAEYPRRVKRKAVPTHHVSVGVIFENGRVLITRRKAEGLLGGLWEFPGGKTASGEDAGSACVREIKEEVNLSVTVDRHLVQVRHAYTHFRIVMDVFICKAVTGRIMLNGPVDYRWIRLDDIDEYPFPRANRKFIPTLIAACRTQE